MIQKGDTVLEFSWYSIYKYSYSKSNKKNLLSLLFHLSYYNKWNNKFVKKILFYHTLSNIFLIRLFTLLMVI